MKGRYPLDALRSLRRSQLDAARRTLGDARRAEQQAEQVASRSRAQREQAERALDGLLQAERANLEQGRLSAADLQRADLHAQQNARSIEALRERERRARAKLARRQAVAAEEVCAVGVAEAHSRAVEQHQERWQQRRELQLANAADEDASDARAARARIDGAGRKAR